MVDTGIFATTLQIQEKAGAGASAVSKAEAYTNSFISQAESRINVLCKYNFSDVYTSLNVDVKRILTEAASNFAAIYVINYDYAGYPSRIDAEDKMNVLRDMAMGALSGLMSSDQVNWIVAA